MLTKYLLINLLAQSSRNCLPSSYRFVHSTHGTWYDEGHRSTAITIPSMIGKLPLFAWENSSLEVFQFTLIKRGPEVVYTAAVDDFV